MVCERVWISWALVVCGLAGDGLFRMIDAVRVDAEDWAAEDIAKTPGGGGGVCMTSGCATSS
jgi:hypothetical protein